VRFWTVFSRWVGPGGPALGSDLPPVGPPAPQDNLLVGDKSLTFRELGQTHRIAIAYAGSAAITANLYIYEEATGLWYKCSPSPLALPANTITFFDVPIPLSTAERLQGNVLKPGGEFHVALVPYNPGGLVNGQYKFAMAPNLSEPSDAASGAATNVNILSPIPLPVAFSWPATIWTPPTIGALANFGVFRNVPGVFYQLGGFSNKNVRRYFMLFDAIAHPANGAPSWICLNVPGNGTFSIDYGRPRGLSWAVSTTPNTLTLDLAAGAFWAQAETG
jgi:hypothetical protein